MTEDPVGFVPPTTRPTPPGRRPQGPGPGEPATGRGGASPVPSFPGVDRVDAAAVLGGAGYTAPRERNDPFAVAALALGVLAVLPGVGVLAVLCGHLALRRLPGSFAAGRGLAVAGLALGYALTALWALGALAVWSAGGS